MSSRTRHLPRSSAGLGIGSYQLFWGASRRLFVVSWLECVIPLAVEGVGLELCGDGGHLAVADLDASGEQFATVFAVDFIESTDEHLYRGAHLAA